MSLKFYPKKNIIETGFNDNAFGSCWDENIGIHVIIFSPQAFLSHSYLGLVIGSIFFSFKSSFIQLFWVH